MKLGNLNLSDVKLGTQQVKKVILGNNLVWQSINYIISVFKTRVIATQGEFEAETCLDTQLTDLNNKGLLDSASFVVTPNGYRETLLYAIEPDKVGTNLLRWSEDFTQTIWLKNGSATVTGNTVTAPDGTNTADTLQRTTTGGTVFQSSVSLTAGQTYTASIYLRADTNGTINIGMASGAVFLLRNITTSWQRYTFTFTQATTTNDGLAIFLQASNTLSSVYAWGAQLELGSTATDYISTTDRAIINGTIGDMSVTRATTGTRVNADGLIEQVPYNLLSRSEEFNNASWFRQNIASITANAALSPINTLTADKIIPDTTSNQHRIFQQFLFTGPGVLSVYAKADGYNFLSLAVRGGVDGGTIIFDLSNGTISGTAGGFVPSIENVGNGWYRCSIFRSDLGAGINVSYWIIVRNNNTTNNYVGDGTSGILVWGAQLVTGTQARDYFPTTNRLNVPRIDYSNGSCPSILVEPQRTNVVLHSGDLSQSVWFKSNYTLSSATAIQGLNATRITKNATDNGFYQVTGTRNLTNFVGTFAAGTKAFSVLIRKGNTAKVGLLVNQILVGSSTFVSCEFDFSTETFTNVSSGLTATFQKPTTDVYRLILVFNDTGTGSSKSIWIAPINNLNNTVDGGYLDFAYAQWELGANATSYIPTTTATVTRSADVITNTNVETLIGQTEGTIYVEFVPRVLNSDIIRMTEITNPFRNGFFILINAQGNLQCLITSNGAISVNHVMPINISNTPIYKVAITYSSGNTKIFVNGILRVTNTTAYTFSFPLTAVAMDSGQWTGSNQTRAITNFSLWKSRLTDTQAIQLTTL